MSIDFDKWNDEFGGQEAVNELDEQQENAKEFAEVPEGTYTCKLEKLELGETKTGKPMIKGMFRILYGKHKNQCIFVNQVFTRGFPQKKGLDFLKSLQIFEDSEIDFNGNFLDFNDLLLDLAENAEGMEFNVTKEKDGDWDRITVN